VRLEEGAYKYSPLPLVEKYNWRNLPRGGTPYLGGTISQTYTTPPANWDLMRPTGLMPHVLHTSGLLNTRHDLEPDSDMDLEIVQGDVAESWQPAPDFSSWTFRLHRDVYFQDIPPVNGREATAEDWAYSFERYFERSIFNSQLEFVDKVSAVDRYTLRFDMKRPVFYLPAVLAGPQFVVFAKEHYEGPSEQWQQQVIGTGAFQVTYSKFQDKLEAVRHPRYFARDKAGRRYPYADNYNVFVVPADITKARFRAGQVDLVKFNGDRLSLEDILSTNPNSRVQVTPQAPFTHTVYVLQHNNPALKDVRVRRALSMAIDRKQFIEVLTGGAAVPAYPVAYDHLGKKAPLTLEELGPYWQYNPEAARSLLREAGYESLELELLAASESNAITLLRDTLAAVGVTIRLQQAESAVVNGTRADKRFNALVSGQVVPGLDPDQMIRPLFYPGSAVNFGNVDDPEMTRLLDQIRFSLDASERQRLATQIHERVLDQVYSLWIYSSSNITIMQPWLYNLVDGPYNWASSYANWAFRGAWVDETAPDGRGGKKAV
jgi:peptide/nickel transport system substrate-binding protein